MNTPGLSFLWPRRFRFPVVLMGFVLVSALGHAVTFYLFHVEYPPSVTLTPPPTRVTFLQPDTPGNRALLAWIADSDPALLARAPEVEPPGIGPSAYEASFATPRTNPLPPADGAASGPVEFPDAAGALATMEHLLESAAPDAAPPPVPPSRVTFSETLAARAPDPLPPLAFSPVGPTPLSAAKFLFAISGSGEPELVFLHSGSGHPDLDREAGEYLRGLQFSPGEPDSVAWGFGTFLWGPEVQRHAPATP